MAYNNGFYTKIEWDEIESKLPTYLTDSLDKELLEYCQNSKGIVLDVGVGTGRVIEELDRKNKLEKIITDIYGIDISESSVKHCRNKFPEYHFSVKNIIDTDFPDEFFDTILLPFCLLSNLDSDKESAVKEINRILKPNGAVNFSYYGTRARTSQENLYVSYASLGFTDIHSIGNYTYTKTDYGNFCSERLDQVKIGKLFGKNYFLEVIPDNLESPIIYIGLARKQVCCSTTIV